MQTRSRVFRMVALAMLSALAFLLMLLNFPLPGLPPFLKMDFSEIPVLIGAIIFGPVGGIIVEALKNLLHYFITGSSFGVPLGEASNFVTGLFLVLPVAFVANKVRTKKGLASGLLIGIALSSVMMAFLNYLILLPLYTVFLDFPSFSAAARMKLAVIGVLPFNLIRGGLTGILFLFLYPKIKSLIDRWNPLTTSNVS
ncbi:ECF transporter S component [Barrientosiimonas marina]|uniref:Riboflavin transporter n=1 Tax=Lentibacillus kimchii TaxID=1542911 RepID=A0ABW2UUF3_9BACI